MSIDEQAKAIVDYIEYREFLAMLLTSSNKDTKLAEKVQEHADDRLVVRSFFHSVGSEIRELLELIKKSGIQTIFVSLWEPSFLPTLASILAELGMLEGNYIFIFSSELVPSDSLKLLFGAQVPGSPMDKLLSGALIFERLDGFRAEPGNDRFLRSWRSQTNETVSLLNALIPRSAYCECLNFASCRC